METLILHPETKEQLAALKAEAKALKIPFGSKTKNISEKKPNKETLKAMKELESGKGISFASAKALFDSI